MPGREDREAARLGQQLKEQESRCTLQSGEARGCLSMERGTEGTETQSAFGKLLAQCPPRLGVQ